METRRGEPLTLGSDNFERMVLECERPVVVAFLADWCAPCRALGPTLKTLAERRAGRAVIGKVDADAHPDLLERYDIGSVPTLVFFRNGEALDRLVGAAQLGTIEERLTNLDRPA